MSNKVLNHNINDIIVSGVNCSSGYRFEKKRTNFGLIVAAVPILLFIHISLARNLAPDGE